MDTITIHTDGSCFPNPDGEGGWAFVVRHEDKHARRFGHISGTTNNEMELKAIAQALKFIRPGNQPIRVVSDSKYCVNALNKWIFGWRAQGWKTGTGTPVKNLQLMRETDSLLQQHRKTREVEVVWVKGHAGNRDNEVADGLAGQARIGRETNWVEVRDTHTEPEEIEKPN